MSDSVTGAAAERGPAPRRELVRQRVLEAGYARVEDLVREFDVSLMTMHRDLDSLENDGWLSKIRGGATANPAALVDAGIKERAAAMRAEKAAIVEVAARMLTHTQTIFLDDSTTVLGLIPHLVQRSPMTVATNFLPAIAALGDAPGVELHVLGGRYHPRQEACQGLQTVEAIERMHADIFFMSTTAVLNGNCLHRSEATVMVRRAFLRSAARRVLLVDHAKFGRPAPYVLCDVAEFDTIITDEGLDERDMELLRNRCADVQVAVVAGR